MSTMSMTSRDRVLCALAHEEPDRVPIFFGASGATTLLAPAYDRLKDYLGIHAETRVFSRALQYAFLDEEVMRRFGADGRILLPNAVTSSLQKELADGAFVDHLGVPWKRSPGNYYYEVIQPPLAEAGLDDIARYPWPDTAHPSRFTGLSQRARAIRDAGFAVVALSGVNPFETACLLRGVEKWLTDLALEPELAHALLRALTDQQKAVAERLLEEAGEYIDVLVTGDDLGSQDAPLISPLMYRDIVKPYHAELLSAIKARTRARVFYHSDGNILPLLDDLVEIGVDLLNPVQVSAAAMGDTAALKKRFGNRLSFCGAIDTQSVLPRGTTADVRQEVRRRIQDLAPGGGYILASVHCIQPDVPPQNICAMLEEALVAGRYPLKGETR
jgi:uroporphyrinogen decarboxylase